MCDRTCNWTRGMYGASNIATRCGYWMHIGTPDNYKYCPYCGGRIVRATIETGSWQTKPEEWKNNVRPGE